MELSDVRKICLRCMRKSDEPEMCPYCGHEKTGQRTWSKALAPGTVLNNKILIGNILGKGGYGITYIGYDMLLEYRVAVKEFFPDEMVDRAPDEKTVLVLDEVNGEEYQKETAAYLREARILAEFSKFPGIVAIKDLFYENNTGYLIMEYLETGNLRKYIDTKGGWIPVEETIELMEPVINILGKLHKSGLIHRDISPDNIMMDNDGSVKLIDFGGSRKLGMANQQVFLGKWGYAPIEQMLSKISEQGPWSDIYSICATLYCMITGDVPQSSYERNEKDELIPIDQYTVQIDKRLAKAIMKGLSLEAKDRQQSVEELYHDIYNRYPDEKQEMAPNTKERPVILRDAIGRIWMGEYPMNEVTGSQVTSDIIYAEYNQDNVCQIGDDKYLRMPVTETVVENSNVLGVIKTMKAVSETTGYRYFKFNQLPWRIVEKRGRRITLESEYVIDYRPYDQDKYLKMSDKEISKVKSGIFWESSKIREWLNSVFIRRAFNEKEKQKLQVTTVRTIVSAFSEKTTYDKVYLPAIEEIRYGFDIDITLFRGKPKRANGNISAPYSHYTAALANGVVNPNSYGLRSRGTIDKDDSYKCGDGYEGHSLSNDKLAAWPLNQCMGIRPVICVNEDDISAMP